MKTKDLYASEIMEKSLKDSDTFIHELISFESNRQERKIVLIPSESICPPAVLEALGSSFSNIYAEGYPPRLMEGATEAEIRDYEWQLVNYRRYADRRFYKGCDYAHEVESLAKWRIAECFETDAVPAKYIHANVQALSGSAANSAVYEAFLEPGDTIMGMSLPHGGHLTHGSEFNRSGKRYRVVSYGVQANELLDYDAIRRTALEHKPKLIVAGFTSYPWAPDWQRFREIADEVGAVLLADVAHPAGLIVAGQFPNPVGIADVITFTTHKTLCGPRGAVILSTDPAISKKIDSSVFPGEQGGPHMNKIAAMSVAFKNAKTDAFKALQKRIVENAKALSDALQEKGVRICYGGTNTHLLVLDLRPLGVKTGYPLMGEIAARILDLAGLVVNKNTIPGDHSATDARGIRLGTPWATQRGMEPRHMEILAGIIHRILSSIHPFTYQGVSSVLPRGKIDISVLEEERSKVRALVDEISGGFAQEAYPHEHPLSGVFLNSADQGPGTAAGGEKDPAVLTVSGPRAWAFLQEACTSDLTSLKPGEHCASYILDSTPKLLAEVLIRRQDLDRFHVAVDPGSREKLLLWFRRLAEGYVLFDPEDILVKVQGPVRVWDDGESDVPDKDRLVAAYRESVKEKAPSDDATATALLEARPDRFDLDKPYFVGLWNLRERYPETAFSGFTPPEESERLKRTGLFDTYAKSAKKIASFAGWEMPIWFTSIQDEHNLVRTAAGLFDLGHMGVLDVRGKDSAQFLDLLTTNYVRWIRVGESQYGYLLYPDGKPIDDLMVYYLEPGRYLVVVNASNHTVDTAWFRAAAAGEVSLDRERTGVRFKGEVILRDLTDPAAGEDSAINIAIQGPASLDAMLRLTDPKKDDALRLKSMNKTEVTHAVLDDVPVWVARTGYTGETVGFEIFVHPERAPKLWNAFLEKGEDLGVRPAGLGARDSLRIEAGLPLFGNELAGSLDINPMESGFSGYVKLHKPFFVGRKRMLEASCSVKREIVRFSLHNRGARMFHPGDLVVHKRSQQLMGWVTSSSPNGEGIQVGMALVDTRFAKPDTPVMLVSRSGKDGFDLSSIKTGDRWPVTEEGVLLTRFPGR